MTNMDFLHRDGVALAFEDTKTDLPPMVLIHGCGCDHSSLAAQIEFFRRSHRVVAVDLRGHGKSDAPHQDYTMASFAEDIMWLCDKLTLKKPIIVGHSMGGNVALELAARFPEMPSRVVMIDSVMVPPKEGQDMLAALAAAANTPQYLEAYRQALSGLCLPTDEQGLQLVSTVQVSQHVLASAIPNHTFQYDSAVAASACHIPVAYIFSIMPFLDLARFQNLTPQLIVARSLGAGHFSPIDVPDQINAMISRFITVT
jgi:pimeloyl-ACP methyl ester carboxylesterase